ncbi:MAG: S-layer homology domain-containing protein, partial [Oscillospiraceae bacterium]|nr:S-layer homology domain-containing protein [Oscillospiraceae bacterium]
DGIEGVLSDYEEGITYSSADENIIKVTPDGSVTAVAKGKADVIATVKNENGKDVNGRVTIEVHEVIPSFTVDFTQTVHNPDYKAYPPSTPGYTIIQELSNSGTYRKYLYNDTMRELLHVNAGSPTKLWPADTSKTTAFAISVDVPFESDYSISLVGGKSYIGAVYSVFVDGEYIGDHSFWSGSYEADTRYTGAPNVLNTVHLTEAAHTIEFKARATYYESTWLTLDSLIFTPLTEKAEISYIEAEIPTELAVGETFDSEVTAYMSDGTVRRFGPDKTGVIDTVTSLVPSSSSGAVEVSGYSQYILAGDGTHPFTLKGISEGVSNVGFTATVNGKSVEKIVAVNVTEDPIVSTTAKTEAPELFANDKTRLVAQPKLKSGRVTTTSAITTVYESETPEIATVEGNMLSTHAEGTARIKVTSTFNNDTVVGYMDVTVLPEGMTDITVTAGGSKYIRTTGIEGDTVPLYAQSISNLGRELDMEGAIITAKALTPEIADIDSKLNIIPVYADPENTSEARFEVTVEMPDGRIRTKEVSLTAIYPKSRASYYTEETVKNARENYQKYDWVKKEVKSNHLDYADQWIDQLDFLYDMIPSEGIPRSIYVGTPSDPDIPLCRYCGKDIRAEYGTYPWGYSIVSHPWKIQCKDCKRWFPSNDFGSFYELGLNEYREFDRARALARHHSMLHHGDANAICECVAPEKEGSAEWNEFYGYGNPKGYLYNEMYSEVAGIKALNGGKGLRKGETVATWGVDDGYGYIPRDENGEPYTDPTGVPERHTYIAYYTHWPVFRYTTRYVIRNFSNAYLYTGDVKYGRAAAILLDRIADFYPDYNFKWGSDMLGRQVEGKTVDYIWETEHVWTYAEAYDIVFDLYEDPYVLDYIKNKSKTIKMKYAKDTPSQIRTHIEDGLLRNAFESEMLGRLNGNFGYDQKAIATAAVVLDTMPETKKWIEYNFLPGWRLYNPTGGGIYEIIMKRVDSDGMADEASGGYNPDWLKNLIGVQTVLEKYDRYKAASIYNIPKYTQMFYALLPVICTDYSAHIGDTYDACAETHWITQVQALEGFLHFKDPVFAQVLYMLNGNSSEGLHYAATENDPERLEDEVQAVIDEYGVLNLDSDMMPNFGYSILRDGGDFTDSTSITQDDTRRNAWMYFGSNNGHGHRDTLNLGMSAFGLNIMPDLGYPAQTGTPPVRMQWIEATLSHNTVSVDEKWQDLNEATRGKAKHFDDAGMVQLMDVSTPYVYSNVEEYRRSVVMIKADDTNSYYVDFFRVLGGKIHEYSIHASSDEIAGTEGLSLVPQMEDGKYKGTYAGINVPFGADPNSPDEWEYDTVYPRGYTWLENVDRDEDPESKFEVDFAIKDFNKAIANSKGLHLRMTVLNGGNIKNGVDTSVAIADGYPPQKASNKNIPKLKYVLLKHTGKNLDTTFTTVFEPYRDNKFIKSADELNVEIYSGYEKKGDAHRALRIEHTSGRVDYVFYSTNRDVTYKVNVDGREIFFRGFVGVYTIQNGENTYKYVNDGDIIGEADEITGELSVISGTVEDFTKDYVFDNEIIIKPDATVSEEAVKALSGRFVHIDNGTERSGSFKIEGAALAEDGSGNIVLDVGGVTPIRNYIDANDMDRGYTYMIAEGQSARIPLSYSEEFLPDFDPVSDNLTVTAGSSISVTVHATSPKDLGITYEAEMLPRGATLDVNTGVITWKPTASQVGQNHFAITAVDDFGRESTVHFYVMVHGSTTGSPSQGSDSEGSTETPSGGGGGGGGAPAPDTDENVKPDDGETTNPDNGDDTPVGEGVPALPSKGFTDLASHAWAADAINSLADEGIIKGTSETTFSPSANITRADFAILLVRAFDLKSDNAENFADVEESDYFASELATARNCGIVGGIGDNKYAPRNTITRQDMMVIVYRALSSTLVGEGLRALPLTDEVSYPDFDTVAEYAKDAVAFLISAGLVNGKNGRIAPTDYTTRAEVAVLIKRILDFVK